VVQGCGWAWRGGCSQSGHYFRANFRGWGGDTLCVFRLPRHRLSDRLAFGASTDGCGRNGDHSSCNTRWNAIAVSAYSRGGSTEPPGLTAPILLGLALHCRRIRIFDFQPKRRAARAIDRAEPLRHDPLAAEPASLAKYNRAVLLEMLV
jgi:hypothetical protein